MRGLGRFERSISKYYDLGGLFSNNYFLEGLISENLEKIKHFFPDFARERILIHFHKLLILANGIPNSVCVCVIFLGFYN